MMNTRPITISMATALHDIALRSGAALEQRHEELLVRRGLVTQEPRRLRLTQLGREALGQYLQTNSSNTMIEPNVVIQCSYWQDFYGLHAEVHYQGDAEPVRLSWAISLDSPQQRLQYVLQDLARRHLLVACCPQHHNPDLEERDSSRMDVNTNSDHRKDPRPSTTPSLPGGACKSSVDQITNHRR